MTPKPTKKEEKLAKITEGLPVPVILAYYRQGLVSVISAILKITPEAKIKESVQVVLDVLEEKND